VFSCNNPAGRQSRAIEAIKAIQMTSIKQDIEIASVAPLHRNDRFGVEAWNPCKWLKTFARVVLLPGSHDRSA